MGEKSVANIEKLDQDALRSDLVELKRGLGLAERALGRLYKRNVNGGRWLAAERLFGLDHHDKKPGHIKVGHQLSYGSKNVLSPSSYLSKASPADIALLDRISKSQENIRRCRKAIDKVEWDPMTERSWESFQRKTKNLKRSLTLGEPDIFLDDVLHYRFDGHGSEPEQSWFRTEVKEIEKLSKLLESLEREEFWPVLEYFSLPSGPEKVLLTKFLNQSILRQPFSDEDLRLPMISKPGDTKDAYEVKSKVVPEVRAVRAKAIEQFQERAKKLCSGSVDQRSEELVALATFFRQDDLLAAPYRTFRQVVSPDFAAGVTTEEVTGSLEYLQGLFGRNPQDAPQTPNKGGAICDIRSAYDGVLPTAVTGNEFGEPSKNVHASLVNPVAALESGL